MDQGCGFGVIIVNTYLLHSIGAYFRKILVFSERAPPQNLYICYIFRYDKINHKMGYSGDNNIKFGQYT